MLRAYVLAGGPGARLRGRLGNLPKALVPFAESTFLDTQLEWLAECGLNRVVLALALRAEPVIERIRTRPADAVPEVAWTVEPAPLGTAGALALAARDERRPFLAVDGDTLAEVDLVALLDLHRRSQAVATLACYRTAAAGGGEGRLAVDCDDSGRVRALGEAAGARPAWVSGGVTLCEPEVLGAVPHARPSGLEEEILPDLWAAGRPLAALRCRGRCYDIGTPEGLARAEREWPGRHGRPGGGA